MLDDRFKWKVSTCFADIIFQSYISDNFVICQVREMEKKKEGKPGEARANLRRSVRENG